MKRQPLLADVYLAQGDDPAIETKVARRAFDALLEAKRFVFDREACVYLGEMIRDVPEVIAHGQDFAIPPFKTMWIELPYFRDFFRVVTSKEPDADADERVGYLFDGPRVYCFAEATGRDYGAGFKRSCGINPIRYRLNQPFTAAEEAAVLQAIGQQAPILDLYYWGETASYWLHGEKDLYTGRKYSYKPELMDLRANHSFDFVSKVLDLKQGWERFYNGSAGDLRNIIAVLVFLNQTSMVRYEDEIAPERTIVKGKTRTLVRHRVIRLRLNPVADIRKRYLGRIGGTGVRREHDVRGHFCHNEAGRSEACDHDWLETGVHQWRCLLCPGKRWWKKEHRRGKKKLGEVKTQYEVTE